MRFGIKTGQGGYTYNELSSIWSKAKELGFDSAWLYDHFIALGNPNNPCLEAYSTLGALARDTRKINLGVMVTCAGYRNPSLLAKIAATVDVISNGRLIMALGAGWYEEEYKAYGYAYLPNTERVRQLRETIKILKIMWNETSSTYQGKYFSIQNTTSFPMPVQKRLPIWVGISAGTKTLPAVAVKEADGFNTMSDLETCRQILDRAEDIRKDLGRNRNEVTYSLQRYLMTGSEQQLTKLAEDGAKKAGTTPEQFTKRMKERGCIMGSPEECAQIIRSYTEAGIDYFIPIIVGDRLLWPIEVAKDKLIPLL